MVAGELQKMWQDIFSLIFLLALPAALLSLVISAIGAARKNFWLVIIGAILFIPFAYYLNGAPGSKGLATFLPLFQIGSAVAIHQKNRLWAWLLLVPPFLAGLWVLGVALFYQVQL
jgi:peptidoglycan/LPS O-acetylase OafA/YrhL